MLISILRSLVFLTLFLSVARADSADLKTFTVFSDKPFDDARWLTIATTEHQGFTIDFVHHAQIVLGPINEIYIIDHFSHRQDRFLKLSVGDGASATVVDLTAKLGITLKNDDIVDLKIILADPLKIKVHIEPHQEGEPDRNSTVTMTFKDMEAGKDLEKNITFPNWTTSFALWSGHGFFQ
jgi:hypothetical protein